MPNRILVIILFIVLLVYGASRLFPNNSPSGTNNIVPTPTFSSTVSPFLDRSNNQLVEPIDQFIPRITKKFFGTYVTPASSPVTPERFQGFHTGVDVEYGDITTDVSVRSIANGVVVTSQYVSGYGGFMVIKHQIFGKTLFAIYGHLRPSSLIIAGTSVSKGQQIALLGTAYSSETDGERRHLHFGIATIYTIKGYVATKTELSANWIDPLSLYR